MTEAIHRISICEVCGNEHLVPVLDLGPHPMCDDLVPVGDSRVCREYPIEIVYCQTCRTAHQRSQVPKRELFPASYHYRSRFTADVLQGMASLVESCRDRFGSLVGKKVADIGCNDGSLLDFFRGEGAVTIGVEPTGAYRDAEEKGHSIYNGFLSEAIADAIVERHGRPDFITFTNVFAHIENLHEVLASLRRLMSADTIIVIENHYLGAVFERNQFDTFYHEHPRTYSYTSFVHMAHSLGVALLDVQFPSRYGGNIRVFMGNAARSTAGAPAVDLRTLDQRESRFIDDFATLRANVERWRASKRRIVAELVDKGGPLRAKAFPGRAAILVRLLGLDETSISTVYEKPGSLKIGNYVPGTRIPIRSDTELFGLPDQSRTLLNFAWHIPREIREYLKDHDYAGDVVDILDAEDFRHGS